MSEFSVRLILVAIWEMKITELSSICGWRNNNLLFSWSNGDQGIEETWASGYPIDDPDFACAYVVRNSQGKCLCSDILLYFKNNPVVFTASANFCTVSCWKN